MTSGALEKSTLETLIWNNLKKKKNQEAAQKELGRQALHQNQTLGKDAQETTVNTEID